MSFLPENILVSVPLVRGIVDLARGEHYGSLGHFIAAVFIVPFVYYLKGVTVSSRGRLAIVLGLIVVTSLELAFIYARRYARRKRNDG